MNKLATIIIPHFNAGKSLGPVLSNLCKQSIPRKSYEVVVVNDGSTETENLQIECSANDVILVDLPKQLGVSSCRNIGLEFSAGSEYTIFLGQDILVGNSFLHEHIKFIESQGECASLGEICFPEDYIMESAFMRWLEGSPYQFDYHNVKNSTASWRNFYTSNIAVKTKEIGSLRFDPGFKYLFEDLDFGYRLYRQSGIEPSFNSKAKAFHLHRRTLEEFIGRQQRAGREAFRFAMKHRELTLSEDNFCVHSILTDNVYTEAGFNKALEDAESKSGTEQYEAFEYALRYSYEKAVLEAHAAN